MRSEQAELIRRYLEGEMTPEEKIAFEAILAHEPALRAEVQALEHLLAAARALPQYRAPADLAARVRARLDRVQERSEITLHPRPAWRPGFRWALPAAAAAAVLLALALFGREAPLPPTHGPEPGIPVTFEVYAPEARTVAVVGDFNQWQVSAAPLTDPKGDGTWTAEVLIPPGRYQYQFVIDGTRWLPDRHAPVLIDDGFGRQNAVLEVAVTAGPPSRLM